MFLLSSSLLFGCAWFSLSLALYLFVLPCFVDWFGVGESDRGSQRARMNGHIRLPLEYEGNIRKGLQTNVRRSCVLLRVYGLRFEI